MRRLPLSDLSPLSQHHLPPRQPPAQGGGALEPAHVALVVRRRVRVHRPVQVEQPITLRARHASRTPASRVEVDQLAPRPVRVPSQNLEGASAALATEREGSGAQQRHLRAEQARHGVGAIDKGLRPHPPHRGAAELAVETGGGSVREGEHLCGRVLRRRVATGARQQAGAEQRHRQRAAEAVAAQGEPLTRTDAELRLDHLAQLLPRWTDQSSYGVSVSSSPSRRSSAAARAARRKPEWNKSPALVGSGAAIRSCITSASEAVPRKATQRVPDSVSRATSHCAPLESRCGEKRTSSIPEQRSARPASTSRLFSAYASHDSRAPSSGASSSAGDSLSPPSTRGRLSSAREAWLRLSAAWLIQRRQSFAAATGAASSATQSTYAHIRGG
mmetsp:Transcript_14610/g.49135  ORF Transcript_14610/g.49135 Transcript_14610/m.49135 type:complete len:388 (+) Transcript_14610:64-1227(+)